jgi:nucleoside-diphosphate-sugar epimerase
VNVVNPFDRPTFIPEFSDFSRFRDATVGITGQRGVLGSILYSRLVQAGIRTESFSGDINDSETLTAWFGDRRFSHFFHFAAVVPVTVVEADPLAAYRTNAIGSFDVCRNVLLTQPQCWLFHCSSSHVYRPTSQPIAITEEQTPDPLTFYGVTKLAAERIIEAPLKQLSAPFCIGRIFSFSHRRQEEPYLVPSLRSKIQQLRDGDTLDVSNPSSVRDIQDAETVIDCVLHLAVRRAQGVVNIGTGEGKSVRDIALSIARTLGKNITVTGIDRDAPGSLIADTRKLRSLLAQ